MWHESPNNPIVDFQLNTLTYSTGPTSFIAQKCLAVLSDEIETSNPSIARAIREDFCMDDLSGAATVKEAVTLQSGIQTQLETAGFTLRKYLSNSSQFLEQIGPTRIEKL